MDPNALYAGMAQKASLVGIAKETPLSRLSYAVERLRKAEDLVACAASKLVGDRGPGMADAAARAPVGSGLFGTIEELADSVSDLASNILSDIQRIENRL